MKTFYEYFNEQKNLQEINLGKLAGYGALALGSLAGPSTPKLMAQTHATAESDSDAGPALALKLQTTVGLQIELDGEDLKIESYSGDKNKFLFKGSATNSKNKDPKRFQQEIKEKLESYLNFSASGNAKDFKIKIEPKKEKAFPSKTIDLEKKTEIPGMPLLILQVLDQRGIKAVDNIDPIDKSHAIYFYDKNGKKTNYLDTRPDIAKKLNIIERPDPNNVTFEGSITIKE